MDVTGLLVVVCVLMVFVNPLVGALLDFKRREQHLRHFQIQDQIILRLQQEFARESRESDDCDQKLKLANALIDRLMAVHAAVRGDVNLTNIVAGSEVRHGGIDIFGNVSAGQDIVAGDVNVRDDPK